MKRALFTFSIALSCLTASAQWTNNTTENNRITPVDKNTYSSQFKVNKDGVTFVAFNMPNVVNKDTTTVAYVQILDKEGNKLFPDEGKLISKEKTRSYTMVNEMIMTDNKGNALIMVSDLRNAPSGSYDLSYTIYKVSPTGEMLWGENGLDLEQGHANALEAQLTMVQLEDGSYVFAWRKTNGNMFCVQMQRVSEDGELLWDDISLKDNTTTYADPYLVNAGNNQVILVYSKGSNLEIMARKIDFDGSPVWPEDTRVYRGGFPSVPLHTILKVLPDPKGGVFIGWNDDREFISKESAYVSYVKPNGQLGFPSGESGEKISYTEEMRCFAPSMAYDEANDCLYLVWREVGRSSQSFQRIMMQKVMMSGELKWGSEGIEIFPTEQISVGYHSIEKAENGKFAAFYMTSQGYGAVTGYVALVDGASSEFAWAEKSKVFTEMNGNEKGGLSTSPLTNGGWITMWHQTNRNEESGEKSGNILYMQRINQNGTFGNTTSINDVNTDNSLSLNSVLSGNTTTFIVNNNNSGMAELSIYTLSGQKVAIAYQGQMNEGKQEINWNAKDSHVAKGIYIATLSTPEGSRSVRFIVKD